MAFAGHSAGGCRNNLARFATNPQYLLTVFDDDVGGGGGGNDSSSSSDEGGGAGGAAAAEKKVRKTMVILSLGQEHRRTQRDRKVKLLQVRGLPYMTSTQLMDFLTTPDRFLPVPGERAAHQADGRPLPVPLRRGHLGALHQLQRGLRALRAQGRHSVMS